MRCSFTLFLAALLTASLVACEGGPGGGSSGLASRGEPDFAKLRKSAAAATGGNNGTGTTRPYLKPRYYKAKLDDNAHSAWGETLEVKVENGTDVAAMIHTTGSAERLVQYTYTLKNDIFTEVEQLSFKLYDEAGKLLKKNQPEPRVLYQFAKDGKKIRTEGSNPDWSPAADFNFVEESEKHLAFFRSSRDRFSEIAK